jgi:predicted O-methyltransferase YrrM
MFYFYVTKKTHKKQVNKLTSISYIVRYLKYYLCSNNEHGLHSPFMFHLVLNVIYLKDEFYDYKNLSETRAQLSNDQTVLNITDFGAGSRVFKGNQRKVKDIVEHGISNEKYARLLFRLVNYFKPSTIVELGTSVGLTTMYLAAVNKKAKVYTLEGSKEIAEFAKQQFTKNKFENIELIEGNFNDTLPTLLNKLGAVDFAYIDGNHTKEASINYFMQLLPKCNERSVLIFDDINWSQGMQEAWQFIKTHERVKLSIDLFFIGIILFRKEQQHQEHFVVRF